jgi:hypothetical protein
MGIVDSIAAVDVNNIGMTELVRARTLDWPQQNFEPECIGIKQLK